MKTTLRNVNKQTESLREVGLVINSAALCFVSLMAYRNAHGELIYVDIRLKQYASFRRAVEVRKCNSKLKAIGSEGKKALY